MTDAERSLTDADDGVALSSVVVPTEHVEQIRAFADALLADQTPDVEGYASILKGFGSPDMRQAKPVLAAVTGTEVVLTVAKDIDSGDSD